MNRNNGRNFWVLLFLLAACIALHVRCTGLFRGLLLDSVFHPDEPKQVSALYNYLRGHYLWYVGSRFYDGYPYGLNHIDEWLLRPVFMLRAWLGSLLFGKSFTPEPVEIPDLYYWARGLRVVYGMLVVLLTAKIAALLIKDRLWILLATLILAISPLSFSVTHFATGDIGVDLFGALGVFFLCLHARRESGYLCYALSGVCIGLAFGCKYNGLLSGFPLALFTGLQLLENKNWRKFARNTLTAVAACAAGILISTPALLIRFKQTRKDIAANFEFIKNYSVDKEILAKPFHEKAWIGLSQNTDDLIRAFEWSLVLLALIGLVAAAGAYKAALKNADKQTLTLRRLSLAIFGYPFIALFVSLCGKVEVQPFHFSYLVPPFVLAAIAGAVALWSSRRLSAKIISVLLVSTLGLQLASRTLSETFFWSNEDNVTTQKRFARTVADLNAPGKSAKVRNIYIETDLVSKFRNRKHSVTMSGGKAWSDTVCIPTPCVPYPDASRWIFMNGPLFPRNDRMFVVKANIQTEKHLVFHERPENLSIGIRSALSPIRFAMEIEGLEIADIELAPNSQHVKEISLEKVRFRESGDRERRAFILTLKMESRLGDAVGCVFSNTRERDRFLLFGGQAGPDVAFSPNGQYTNLLTTLTRAARFLEEPRVGRILNSRDEDTRDFTFPAEGMYLPSGPYILDLKIENPDAESSIRVTLDDTLQKITDILIGKTNLVQGLSKYTFSFAKPFAPHFSKVRLTSERGTCNLVSWNIRPDYTAITQDLENWAATGKAPEWSPPPATRPPELPSHRLDAEFDGAIHLHHIAFPETVSVGSPVYASCEVSVRRYSYRLFEEVAFFMHIISSDGTYAAYLDFPLRDAFTAHQSGIPVNLLSTHSLAPGEYDVMLGMWHPRTNKRLSVRAERLTRREKYKRRLKICTLTVTP